MNRRKFLKSLVNLALVGTFSSLTSCSKEKDETPKINPTRKIKSGDNIYSIQNGVLTQNGSNNSIKLGILADTHAHKENTEYFTNELEKEKVDVYILPGDLSHSFGDYEGAKDDYNEIKDVLTPVAETGKPVFVYSGNHEQRKTYRKALDDLTLQYNNIIDMQIVPVADLNGLTIVGLGGNDNPRFNVPEGFLLNASDFERLGELAEAYQKDKPLLIATHIPQKYSTQRGIDIIENGQNVGSSDLRTIRKSLNSRFGLSGHIHEAYGLITPDEQPVKQGELSDELDFNPGAVYDHLRRPNLKPAAGILEFRDNKARAYIINR